MSISCCRPRERGDLGETIAAMTPCMRLYAFLGPRAGGHPSWRRANAEWVKTYADPGFEALAMRLEELLDRHAADSEAGARQLSSRHGTRVRLLRRPTSKPSS